MSREILQEWIYILVVFSTCLQWLEKRLGSGMQAMFVYFGLPGYTEAFRLTFQVFCQSANFHPDLLNLRVISEFE